MTRPVGAPARRPAAAPADASLVSRVEAVLAAFLRERADALADLGPDLAPALEQARTFVLDGGKRLRPRFAYWGWRAAGGPAAAEESVVTAAASLELLHACALVHDDVMDDSATRRGRPATHVVFEDLHSAAGYPGPAGSFGVAGAILLGDLLLSWSDALFARSGLGGAARERFDLMREHVMAGQYLDVLVQARGGFDTDDALRVIAFKTSKYTVEGPLLLGAAAAGAGPEVLDALGRYGSAVGEAFQLRDDVLGVFGDPAVTGKPAGDDLREGKRTLLLAYAMQRADPAQAAVLRDQVGRPELDERAVQAVRRVIVDTGALHRVEQRVAEQAAAAVLALAGAPIQAEARDALATLVDSATRRAS